MEDERKKINRDEEDFARPEDPRSQARELAVQFLHLLNIQGEPALGQIDNFLRDYTDNVEARAFARELIIGAWRQREALDELIRKASSHWDLARINQVDRGNLRLAVYQFLYLPDIPVRVVLNEAVELAKKFSTAQAPGFINGVLEAVRREIKSQEKP